MKVLIERLKEKLKKYEKEKELLMAATTMLAAIIIVIILIIDVLIKIWR